MFALQHPERQYSNIGGLETFLFADAESLLYDPRPRRDLAGNLVIQSLPLIGGAKWQVASVVKFSLGYRERQRENQDGISYRQQLSGVIAKHTPIIANILRQFENRRFVLLVKDLNGYYRLVGSKESPMEFAYQSDPGASPRDRNEISWEFEGEQAHPAWFYSGDLLNQVAQPASPEEIARITENGIYIRILE